MRAKRTASGKALEMAYSKQTTQIYNGRLWRQKMGNKDKPRSNKQADGEVLYKCGLNHHEQVDLRTAECYRRAISVSYTHRYTLKPRCYLQK